MKNTPLNTYILLLYVHIQEYEVRVRPRSEIGLSVVMYL